MNNTRRKMLAKVIDRLENEVAVTEELTEIRDEEQEAFDNLPDSLQYSEKGEAMEMAIEAMDEAIMGIHETFENVKTLLETASE